MISSLINWDREETRIPIHKFPIILKRKPIISQEENALLIDVAHIEPENLENFIENFREINDWREEYQK